MKQFDQFTDSRQVKIVVFRLEKNHVDESHRRASFSNTGKHIKLVAPGVNILSTVPRMKASFADHPSYDSWPGTSMATPHVTGAAALLDTSTSNAGTSRTSQELAPLPLPLFGNSSRTAMAAARTMAGVAYDPGARCWYLTGIYD